MKAELISFRLMILVVFGSILAFGSGWVYMTQESNDWQSLVSQAFERMNHAASACEKEKSLTHSCEFYEIWKEQFDSAVTGRDEATEWAGLLGTLTLVVPLVTVILFYALRWTFTGRVRPFHVR